MAAYLDGLTCGLIRLSLGAYCKIHLYLNACAFVSEPIVGVLILVAGEALMWGSKWRSKRTLMDSVNSSIILVGLYCVWSFSIFQRNEAAQLSYPTSLLFITKARDNGCVCRSKVKTTQLGSERQRGNTRHPTRVHAISVIGSCHRIMSHADFFCMYTAFGLRMRWQGSHLIGKEQKILISQCNCDPHGCYWKKDFSWHLHPIWVFGQENATNAISRNYLTSHKAYY